MIDAMNHDENRIANHDEDSIADHGVNRNNNVAPECARLSDIVNGSGNIVFFGGAGVSTASGIPDFRSGGGLYKKPGRKTRLPPEAMISASFFFSDTDEFFAYYRDNLLFLDAAPNPAHYKLAEMESAGRLRAVITQNIDGLHQKAGSRNVVELHGSVHRNYCLNCRAEYDARFIAGSRGIPACERCGGIVKPDVVLYGENLNHGDIGRAIGYIEEADVLIVGGTSLVVYPAAGLVQYYKGKKLIIINKSETDRDGAALLTIRDGIADAMGALTITNI